MEPTAYASAIPHYLSADRRDPVKRLWEEPFSRNVLRSAAAGLGDGGQDGSPLRVLDVGSGTGDGYELLSRALQEAAAVGSGTQAQRRLEYVGMDCDASMVATANELHDEVPSVSFVEGDVLSGVPDQPFDLYMSAGVPYSHLAPEELRIALKGIMSSIRENGERAALVVDVLGRYSLEWPTHWDSDRWNYQMTFFHDAPDTVSAPMTFYSRTSLDAVIQDGAAESGLTLEHVDYFDRSIMVGRHTGTNTFGTAIPEYRLLVNRLYEGDCDVDLADLILDNAPSVGPADVVEFFGAFSSAWNTRVEAVRAAEQTRGPSLMSRTALASRLCDLEHGLQPGLGSGHSLIGVAYLDAA
jgi:SAM-dependent methyltransferase